MTFLLYMQNPLMQNWTKTFGTQECLTIQQQGSWLPTWAVSKVLHQYTLIGCYSCCVSVSSLSDRLYLPLDTFASRRGKGMCSASPRLAGNIRDPYRKSWWAGEARHDCSLLRSRCVCFLVTLVEFSNNGFDSIRRGIQHVGHYYPDPIAARGAQ